MVTFSVVVAVGCSQNSRSLCDGAISIPSYTLRFLQGLDNFAEDQYEQLRLDTLNVLETLNEVAVLPDVPDEASQLAIKVNRFVSAMDDVDWDVSLAVLTKTAVDSATELGSTETLSQANAVDALVISECGLPSTLPPIAGVVETLPPPSIPAPTETIPDASPPVEESENLELGRLVADIFRLTLSQNDMLCLGTELMGVVDVSGAQANLAQYQGQFQNAFDNCSIDFRVPVD